MKGGNLMLAKIKAMIKKFPNPYRGTWNIETKMHGRKANNCR